MAAAGPSFVSASAWRRFREATPRDDPLGEPSEDDDPASPGASTGAEMDEDLTCVERERDAQALAARGQRTPVRLGIGEEQERVLDGNVVAELQGDPTFHRLCIKKPGLGLDGVATARSTDDGVPGALV